MSALVVLIPLLLACLVLQPNDTKVFNRPPILNSSAIHRSNGKAIEQMVVFDKRFSPTELALPIMVRDLDDDPIKYRVFLDYDPTMNMNTTPVEFQAFVSAEPVEQGAAQEVTFTLRADLFPVNTCHRVELFASSGFKSADAGPTPFEPTLDGDVAHVMWWVQVVNSMFLEPVKMDQCPR